MGAVITTPITVTLTLLSTRPSDFIFWYKWMLSYIWITASRYWNKRRFDLYDMEAENDPYATNYLPPPEEHILELPLSDNQLLNQNDEVFFYGVNSKSQYLLVRVVRGLNDEADALIYLRLEDGRTFRLRQTSGYQQCSGDVKTFSCGSLQVQYQCPMRRWRMVFNGMLSEELEGGDVADKMVHVKFALQWVASSDAFDFGSDLDVGVLATGMARSKWKGFFPPVHTLEDSLDAYAQRGVIRGMVQVAGCEDEQELYLFGERIRSRRHMSSMKNVEFYHILGLTPRDGRLIHIAEESIPNLVENMTYGFVLQPSSIINAASDATFTSDGYMDNDKKYLEATFLANGNSYVLKGNLVDKVAEFQNSNGWDGRLTVDCFKFELNSVKGSGFVIKGKVIQPAKRLQPKLRFEPLPKVIPMVVNFSEKICQFSDVTGGKGSSLGKLMELSEELENFIVPNGVVVTTSAYEKFMNPGILESIKNLEDVLFKNKSGDVKSECHNVMQEIINSSIPDPVLQAIILKLEDAFKGEYKELKFAVRSSATGEDTDQLSAAGQMETYLGVTGITEIMAAVKKCWASQFSFVAAQYKWQNGQVLNSPMAVVIQKMVSCNVAGVLFTCDPLTGNPTKMSITANYGLGESVVSGAEEPDTIEVERAIDDSLEIRNKTIGSKLRRIVMKDDGGTVVEEVSDMEKSACCLSDSDALRLAELAVKIEKSYRSRRDIEWGYWNENFYIFQSRPVTTGSRETDYEIDHEKDAPMWCEGEYFTVHNVGEVMPGSMSPLGSDLFFKYFHVIMQRKTVTDFQSNNKPKYFFRNLIQLYFRSMLYVIDLFEQAAEDPEAAQFVAIGFFGKKLENEDMMRMVKERFQSKDIRKRGSHIETLKRIYRVLFQGKISLRRGQKVFSNYRFAIENIKTSTEMFDTLLSVCTDPCEYMAIHLLCTESSSLLTMKIFTILQQAAGQVNADVYSDFGKLVATCSEVESADVPAAVEDLSRHIRSDINPQDFKKMDVEAARCWLETTKSQSGIKYKEFLSKHGHRCLRELDARSLTWSMDPKPLIKLLQNLVGSGKTDREKTATKDTSKMISDISIPLDWKSRLGFRLILPLTRQTVQRRESSKSLMIRALNDWRKGYRKLAKLMVSEGRIPDEDLIFFMYLEEIKELLETRSPKIIAKASHRRRRYPILDKYLFPEIMKGFPMPINLEKPILENNDSNFSMTGIPVSQGIAKGIVRVALDLEEASHLQPGEILVTYSTDIGWSPYFSMLGGIVTEIGGLISHGAVVSREYGLPCIAGLTGATQYFNTGDYVLLDGNKGVLQKLPKPEVTE